MAIGRYINTATFAVLAVKKPRKITKIKGKALTPMPWADLKDIFKKKKRSKMCSKTGKR